MPGREISSCDLPCEGGQNLLVSGVCNMQDTQTADGLTRHHCSVPRGPVMISHPLPSRGGFDAGEGSMLGVLCVDKPLSYTAGEPCPARSVERKENANDLISIFSTLFVQDGSFQVNSCTCWSYICICVGVLGAV